MRRKTFWLVEKPRRQGIYHWHKQKSRTVSDQAVPGRGITDVTSDATDKFQADTSQRVHIE